MSQLPEEPVRAELADMPPELVQPPLSIGHLLLWILGSALVLASYRSLAEPKDPAGGRYAFFLLDQVLRSITLGGGVAALLVYARRLVTRNAPLPRQPGHWLLVVQGLVWPAYWLTLASIYGLRGAEPALRDPNMFRRYLLAIVPFYLWGTALYLAVLFFLRDAKRWRILFAVSAIGPLAHALLWCCIAAEPSLGGLENPFILVRIGVTLPLLLVCVLRDRAQRVPRDWLHAAGVGIYVLGSLTSLGVYLLTSLAR